MSKFALSLDALDIRILSELQEHGQLSKSALAERVNLSPSACWSRLTKLKNDGLIRGYRADIALDKLVDFVKVVVVISLKTHRKIDFERFENCIVETDQIVDCIATGGGSDYVMTTVNASLAEFQSLMDELLDKDIGIDRYFTYIVTRQIKSKAVQLSQLVSQ